VVAPGREIRTSDLPAEFAAARASRVRRVGPTQLAAGRSAAWTPAKSPLLEDALPTFERTLIRVALARSGGHRQEAARLLGWGRNTLARKIRELGLDD
jgi:two-component system, NtrC family, nitrogen regulation response regulator GlnG